MARLIDADAFKTRLEHEAWSRGPIELLRARDIADETPTVDAVPVRHGKWIRDEFGARCSDCGLYAYRDKFDKPWESPYCPICGARMDEE